MKVLIVEDNPLLSGRITRVFDGDETAVAATGRDAIAAVGNRYDVVTLDVGLPDMSGIDVCRAIRGAGYAVPILILTAEDSGALREAAERAGANGYMTKPFDGTELRATARALVAVAAG